MLWKYKFKYLYFFWYYKAIYSNNEIKECRFTCEEGKEEKCLTCDLIRNRCLTCNKGYYLPEDDSKICKKCKIENCEKCYDNSIDNICTLMHYFFYTFLWK